MDQSSGCIHFRPGNRADQTSRILDIKYHMLLPAPAEVGSAVDLAQWMAVLRPYSAFDASEDFARSRLQDTPSSGRRIERSLRLSTCGRTRWIGIIGSNPTKRFVILVKITVSPGTPARGGVGRSSTPATASGKLPARYRRPHGSVISQSPRCPEEHGGNYHFGLDDLRKSTIAGDNKRTVPQ